MTTPEAGMRLVPTLGDRVEKISGSSWRGRVVGFYSTDLTPNGVAVESENEPGSVQIYPAKALRAAAPVPPAYKPLHEVDSRAVCEALGFDPTNHHNAAKCPYCTPTPTVPPAGGEGPPLQMLYELRHPDDQRTGWEDNAQLMAAAADTIEALAARAQPPGGEVVILKHACEHCQRITRVPAETLALSHPAEPAAKEDGHG